MNIQLQEIKSLYIKNRLTEGVDFKRYEWLKGDGVAYIDTLHLANEGLEWETHVSNLSFKKYFVWNRVVAMESPAIALYHSAIYNGTVRVQNNYTNSIELQNQTNYDYIVATNSNGVVINGVQYIGQSTSENISNKSIKLFYCDIDATNAQYITFNKGSNSQDVKCTYFRFLDSNRNCIQNLIPCTLLHSIPASLDANNIARAAGECGMYDSISGKFFGNVASSGTFTVEGEVEPETHPGLQQIYQNKLIEGVDYETADWLRYIDWVKPENNNNSLYGAKLNCELRVTTRLQLTIKLGEIINNINNSEIELVVSSSTKTYYIRCTYFDNNIAVYSPSSNRISDKYYLGSELNFIITEEGLFVNDIHLINEKIEYISQFGHETRSCRGSISSITTEEGVDVLVPCTLLRSIPRNLDAQCKERVAGECGMIDLISGKFYGNVASSGTFTVENDNNE